MNNSDLKPSNTGENRPGTFVKGDKRINRNGRPRIFDQLRGLTVDMFNRLAKDANGNQIMIEGRPATIIEVTLWKLIHSKDPRDIQYAISLAYGKVPDNINIDQIMKVIVEYADEIDPTEATR